MRSNNPLNVHEGKSGIVANTKRLYETVNNKAVETSKITDICFNNIKYKTQMASIDVSGVLKIWDIASDKLL